MEQTFNLTTEITYKVKRQHQANILKTCVGTTFGNILDANQSNLYKFENYRSGLLDVDPMNGVRGLNHKKRAGGWGA